MKGYMGHREGGGGGGAHRFQMSRIVFEFTPHRAATSSDDGPAQRSRGSAAARAGAQAAWRQGEMTREGSTCALAGTRPLAVNLRRELRR